MSSQTGKPVLDEQALGRLLEAAFVLQEHNRRRLGLEPSPEELQTGGSRQEEATAPPATDTRGGSRNDYTLTLAHIVETQRQIQSRHLDLENSTTLVAERILDITGAAGAAIGILDEKNLRYRAAAGSQTLRPGTEVPMDKALSGACLRVGQVVRCRDVNTEFLVDVEDCRRRGIQSLIAVPIYHNGEVAGALELYFANINTFTEQDVHSCQLMAGLVTEAFARDDELAWKKSLAAERATMLEALEKLKPNLAALVESAANQSLPPVQNTNANGDRAVSPGSLACWKCGLELVADEQFCGKCGAPRVKADDSGSMQSKMASLWQMQERQRKVEPNAGTETSIPPAAQTAGHEDTPPPETLDDELLASLQAGFDPGRDNAAEDSPADLVRRLTEPESGAEADPAEETANPATETALVTSDHAITWSSAAKARDFLEQLTTGQDKASAFARFWNTRRGDIYLAVAVILVAVVIRWGIWSSHSASATGGPTAAASHRRPDPNADLSMLDRWLISVGLAEAPDAPEYRGNPETQVWVDTHTALYYCPGTDLYGKTPKGKYTTQRDAQLDQFEPAYRKACE